MTQFAIIEAATDRIVRGRGRPDPVGFAGVPDLAPFPHNGLIYRAWQGRLDFSAAPSAMYEYRWIDDAPQWVEVGTLDQRRAARTENMRQACEAQIFSGFLCAALGASYLYPAKERDQANLIASVTDSLMAGGDPNWRTPFWCADAAGVWEFRMHTIAQIQQVGREGKAAILAALSKNELLARQIATASAEQLAAIVW